MITRRGFIQLLGAAAAVSAGGIELLELELPSTKTIFLPPAGGWSFEPFYIVRRAFVSEMVHNIYNKSHFHLQESIIYFGKEDAPADVLPVTWRTL